MTQANLIGWIGYWDRATGPNLHKVHSLADMTACRIYNPAMQNGLMHNVTDEQMWDALQEHRRAA